MLSTVLYLQTEEITSGFQIGEEKSVFLDKIVSFRNAHLNSTSECRRVDSLRVIYVTAVKLSLNCFESM